MRYYTSSAYPGYHSAGDMLVENVRIVLDKYNDGPRITIHRRYANGIKRISFIIDYKMVYHRPDSHILRYLVYSLPVDILKRVMHANPGLVSSYIDSVSDRHHTVVIVKQFGSKMHTLIWSKDGDFHISSSENIYVPGEIYHLASLLPFHVMLKREVLPYYGRYGKVVESDIAISSI